MICNLNKHLMFQGIHRLHYVFILCSTGGNPSVFPARKTGQICARAGVGGDRLQPIRVTDPTMVSKIYKHVPYSSGTNKIKINTFLKNNHDMVQ